MSWLGVKYALGCRDERVKGGMRLVLVALGARVEYRRVTTSPTSLSVLRWLTLLSSAQLRRNLDVLEDLQKVRRLSRGKHAVYGLPEMAGPLFAVDAGESLKMSDFLIDELPQEIAQNARKVSGRMSDFRRRMSDFAGVRAGGVLFSDVPSTRVRTSTAAARRAEAEAILAWGRTEYPTYNRGAVLTQPPHAEAIEILVEQLTVRDADRIKAMWRALWTITPSEDGWCFDSDRSLFALRHAADRLDRICRTREATAQPELTLAWVQILDLVRASCDEASFERWIAALAPMYERDTMLFVRAPTARHRDELPKELEDRLRWAVRQVRKRHVEFMWPSEPQEAVCG